MGFNGRGIFNGSASMAASFNVQKFLADRLGRDLPSDTAIDVRFASERNPSVAITGSPERAAFVEETRDAFARVLQLPLDCIELRNVKVPLMTRSRH